MGKANSNNQAMVKLLTSLVGMRSISGKEEASANLLASWLESSGVNPKRFKNNIWAYNKHFDESKPTILLNSHHDTVQPNSGYTMDPFEPHIIKGKLYGLGSNDAGGALVSLLYTFLHYYEAEDLKYNLCLALSAEEEKSGKNGMELLYPKLGPIEFAIVGEPTEMDIAIAEKGLMVLDCTAYGKSGHAAHQEGENALYKAIDDIDWIRTYTFPEESDYLGPVVMTCTMIDAGTQHNVIPDSCRFTVDVRSTDAHDNESVLKIVRNYMKSEVVPRSTRLNASFIDSDHPFVKAAVKHGARTYGSPTTSDQALIPAPSAKMGPGHSQRSHSPDEFIFLQELYEGLTQYINTLDEIL